jgi:hypothetical protein
MSNHLSEKAILANGTYIDISRSRLDLAVLRHMARKFHMALKLLDLPAIMSQPFIYFSEERRSREHRIVIFNHQELLLNKSLTFVGFISSRQKTADTTVASEITRSDDQLLTELVNISGILGYSSLELRKDSWYNLVLLRDAATREHVKGSATHAYAAYQLAPLYYAWVRLHHGILPHGLAQGDMQLLSTKYYTFHVPPYKPIIIERSYVVHDIVQPLS